MKEIKCALIKDHKVIGYKFIKLPNEVVDDLNQINKELKKE